MISDDRIRAELNNVLDETDFEGMGMVERGKVRDSYRKGDVRILVTSDRISAFDCVMPNGIPNKGPSLFD